MLLSKLPFCVEMSDGPFPHKRHVSPQSPFLFQTAARQSFQLLNERPVVIHRWDLD